MSFLEKNLEQIIMDTSNEVLRSRGLDCIHGKKKNQIKIPSGILDVLTFQRFKPKNGDPFIVITLYELKRDYIDFRTISQAFNYLSDLQDYFEYRSFDVYFEVCLIGSKIDRPAINFIKCLNHKYPLLMIPNVFAYTYSYQIDGLSFESCNNQLFNRYVSNLEIDFYYEEIGIDNKEKFVLNKYRNLKKN